MQDSVLPKKTRDIESESSVDKLIESINRLLEGKMVSIEFLFSFLANNTISFRGDSLRAYNNLVVNGDFVSLWNQLIRVYTTEGISRTTQEAIKVKLQDLKTNIDAIDYGLGELFQIYIEGEEYELDNYKQANRLLQSQAIYRNVKNQLNQGQHYRQINTTEVEISLKEVISELSEEQRKVLKRIGDQPIEDRSLLKLPIQLGQNAERIRALESEMGFNLPEPVKENIGQLTKRQEDQAFKEIREVRGELPEVVDGQSVESLRQDYQYHKDRLDQEKMDINKNIPELKSALRRAMKDLTKQRRYIQQFPEQLDEKEEYSPELRGEEEKYQQIEEYIQTTRQVLNENLLRQRDIRDDEENLRQWFENSLQQLEESKLERQQEITKTKRFRKASETVKPDRPLARDINREIEKEERMIREEEKEERKRQRRMRREKEEKEEKPSSAIPKKDYYAKGYLKTLERPQLGAIASKFGFQVRSNSTKDSLIKKILELQGDIPEEERSYVGMGKSAFPLQLGQKRSKRHELEMSGGAFEFNDSRNDLYTLQGLE